MLCGVGVLGRAVAGPWCLAFDTLAPRAAWVRAVAPSGIARVSHRSDASVSSEHTTPREISHIFLPFHFTNLQEDMVYTCFYLRF